MQSTTLQFRQLAAGHVRPLSWGLSASFDKTFNEATTFFTLDESVLDGIDILAPLDDIPIQASDKYAYQDFRDRVISLEVVREETEPYSVVQAFADISLNNYDGYFTPGSGSPIDNYILPRRPFRLSMGFNTQVLQQIVGLSDDMPDLDKVSGTASFHVIDFMSYLLDRDISETVMLENVRTHEVLDYLLQHLGLSEDQYALDGSVNTIRFFYVERGTTFGNVVSKLIEAEIGAFFLDEHGIIRFKNRYNYDLTPVYTFDKSNTINYSVGEQPKIINSVKITGDVREVQSSKSVGTSSSTPIGVGEEIIMFINFNDPVTSVVDPVYSATPISSSHFISALNSDGTGAYTDVVLNDLELFSQSAKLTFENVGSNSAYIAAVNVYGTPAEVVDTIDVREIDQSSINKFEEQIYEINNEYLQTTDNAQTRALMLLRDYKDYANTIQLEVKGSSALQMGDAIDVDLDGFQGVYVITKTANILSGGGFKQSLRAIKKLAVSYFVLDESVLDGSDLLSI